MATNKASPKDIRQALKVVVVFISIIFGLYLFMALIAHLIRSNQPWEDYRKPDDTKVARELLAQKFTGPSYFLPGTPTDLTPLPYLTPAEARRQIDRIIEVRGLPSDTREKLEKLIGKLTEPVSSRVVGIDRVNALQLNLALDEMK